MALVKDVRFVWREALIMLAISTINIFLIIPDILCIIFNH